MAADSMKETSMKKNEMTMDTTKKDNMMSSTLTLSSTAVDLSKHLGQKVSVTGSLAPQMTSMDGQGRDGEGARGIHGEIAEDGLRILLAKREAGATRWFREAPRCGDLFATGSGAE